MKKRQMQSKKKKCARQTRKRDEAGFFDPLFFLSFPFQIKILIKERALILNIVSSLLSALLRFSSSSLGVFIRRTSRWSRARVYIYIYLETRDLDAFHSRDETRKRERRKENDVRERRRSRRKKGRGRRKIESFFRSGRLRESERRREKEREETRLSSSFQTL